MISWNKEDFIAFLEATPQEDEDYDLYSLFDVTQGALELSLKVNHCSGDVSCILGHGDFPEALVHLTILGCQIAKVAETPEGKCIEFAPGVIFGGRYDQDYVIDYGFRLYKEPNFRIVPFKK